MINKEINIIGGGCAAFSFARLSNHLPNYRFNLFIGKNKDKPKDHFWGFWKNNFNDEAFMNANHTWTKWAIQTKHSRHILESKKHPYCVIKRQKWLDVCKRTCKSKKIKIFEKNVYEKSNKLFTHDEKIEGDLIFDSRPPSIPNNTLLQHFEGFVINSTKDVFDDKTVILMDFRCDQSKGLHFIYLLPFSKRKALVESTMFSKKIANKKFYSVEISKYLRRYFNLDKFTKSNHEKGVIPMHYISKNSEGIYNIGTRGGAVRPSSGYAFTFIQKQVFQIVSQLIKGRTVSTNIHKKLDLFLDNIFINVINEFPLLAPKIFSTLAKTLNGDEWAKFMSGNSNLLIICKIILSMPKLPFIKSFLRVVYHK